MYSVYIFFSIIIINIVKRESHEGCGQDIKLDLTGKSPMDAIQMRLNEII